MDQGLFIQRVAKADISFFQAFTSLSARQKRTLSLQIFILVAFLGLYIFCMMVHQGQYDDDFGSLLIIISMAGFFGTISKIFILSKFYSNISVYLTIADLINHNVQQQPVNEFSSIKNCTSETVYIRQNEIRRQDLNDQGRKLIQNITKIRIESSIKQSNQLVRILQTLASGIALASIIYGLFVLITVEMLTFWIVLLSLYVALTFFRQIFYVIILLLIALSPLLCIILCFVCCCCKPIQAGGGGQFINLPSKTPTQTDMLNCEGTCPICRTSIDESSKVYVLPCSEKHVFHSICLSQWARIRNTCPSCRAQIPMTNEGRQSQIREQSQPDQV